VIEGGRALCELCRIEIDEKCGWQATRKEQAMCETKTPARDAFDLDIDHCGGCGEEMDDRSWTYCGGGGPECGDRCPECGVHKHEPEVEEELDRDTEARR